MAEERSKKRKLGAEPSSTDGEPKKLSKEKRREAKRLKKAREVASSGVTLDIGINATVPNAEEDKIAAKAAKKAGKAKRKAEESAAVRKKAEAEEKSAPRDTETAIMNVGVTVEMSAQEARDQAQAQKEARTRMIVNGIGKPFRALNGNDLAAAQNTDIKVINETRKAPTVTVTPVLAEQVAKNPDALTIDTSNGKKKKKRSKEETLPDKLQDHTPSDEAGYAPDQSLASLPQKTIDEFLRLNHIRVDDPIANKNVASRPILDFKYLPQSVTDSQTDSLLKSYKTPTPIQAAAWPYLLAQRDVIGIAETGSGKTLAFGIPCVRAVRSLQSSKKSSRVRAVIVSPTRELASQIHAQLETLASAASLSSICIYGGVPKAPQREALKSAHIVVATPGRLNDLVEEGQAKLDHVKYVVLDEADRMLDTGFEDAIKQIMAQCPPSSKGRQTSMFTATWPQSVRELAGTFMVSPVHVAIGANNPNNELRANKNVKQTVEVLDSISKEGRLRELVRAYSPSNTANQDGMSDNRILIFCLYKKECARIEKMLRKMLSGAIKGIACIHGDMSQPLRTASLREFKNGNLPVLVATDVAARGLDIPDVKVVINYTFPLTVEDYVHRIGRTGRAGKEGLSVTLFTNNDKHMAGELVNVLRAGEEEIPEELLKFDLTVKKKEHGVYGKFYREPKEGEKTKGTMTVLE